MVVQRALFKSASDPGIGDPKAPIGTVPWAQHWRLNFQGCVEDMDRAPEHVEAFKKIGEEHRAWTLLNKRDGSLFRTWEEFCATPRPWGLEIDPVRFTTYLEAKHGKQAAQLATAPPDTRKLRDHDEHGHFTHSHQLGANGDKGGTTDRVRAVLRAPQAIQALYRDGLIGQTEAAKLGPDRPTPEHAAKIAEITEAVRGIAKPSKRDDAAKLKRDVNATVRTMLGQRPATPLARAEALAWSMSLADLAAAIPLLTSIHAERVRGAQKPRRGRKTP